MANLRGPCDCPACQAGDEEHCFWVMALQLGVLVKVDDEAE